MKITSITWIGTLITISLATMFGIMNKPTEMGIIVVACAISLAFINIGKIQKFKGAGFEAEMKRAVEEANATVKQLREVATTSSEVVLTDLMAGNFMSGMTLEKRLHLHDQLIKNLKDIGASDHQIIKADKMWKKGIELVFHRGIRVKLEGRKHPNIVNIKAGKHVLEASKEFQDLVDIKEWKTPPSDFLRKFIENKEVMNQEIDDLLKDFSEFENSGNFRRRDVFIKL